MVTEAVQQVLGDRAVGICDSPVGPLPARRRARSAATPSELWFDYFGLNHLGWLRGVRDGRRRPPARACWPTTTRSDGFEEGRLFGGEWLRSLGMIPNEYLYYFYYARRHGRRDPRSAQPARRVPARAAGRVLRAQRPGARGGAGGLARDPRTSASAPTWPRRAAPPASRRARRRRRRRRLRGRGDGGRRGDRAQHARGADPQHRQPLRAAVPRRARGRRGAVRRRPRRPACRSPSAPVPAARARADRARSRTSSARRSRPRSPARPSSRSRRSRCTRWCRRSPPRARSSTATATRLPELQERFA